MLEIILSFNVRTKRNVNNKKMNILTNIFWHLKITSMKLGGFKKLDSLAKTFYFMSAAKLSSFFTNLTHNFVLEVHGWPDDLELFEHPLHGHFFDGLVDDVVNLILEVVQVQVQQVGQCRVFTHHEVDSVN